MFARRRTPVASIVMLMTSPVWATGFSPFWTDEGGSYRPLNETKGNGQHIWLCKL